MNEAERFLLDHWQDARLLEESMDDIRTKYKELFEGITQSVTESHRELDASRSAVTQFWGQGSIGFGRRSWPSGESNWPSGLWVENLRLEVLTAEDSEPPYACIWVPKKTNLEFAPARLVVNEAARELLAPEDFEGAMTVDEQMLLYLPAPSKRELLSALSNGDGQRFVELFVSQFDMMARFVPVLDKVFRECLKKD